MSGSDSEDIDQFLFDASWLAVRGATTARIVEVLELSDTRPVAAAEGLNAVLGDYWDLNAPPDANLTRVFISAPIQGWTFVVGATVSDTDPQLSQLRSVCASLSEHADACAFTEHGRMGDYSWVLAKNGVVHRAFRTLDEDDFSFGTETPEETKYFYYPEVIDDVLPPSVGEELVHILAQAYSYLPTFREIEASGEGFLARTQRGREIGEPQRED